MVLDLSPKQAAVLLRAVGAYTTDIPTLEVCGELYVMLSQLLEQHGFGPDNPVDMNRP